MTDTPTDLTEAAHYAYNEAIRTASPALHVACTEDEVDQALDDITTATLGATLMHVITAQRDAVRAAILGGAS